MPQIVIPLFFEQPWNADQIQWLGAGVSLACKYPIRRSDLGTKLGKALPAAESDSMRLAAQQIGRSMRAHRWTAAQKAASKHQSTAMLAASAGTAPPGLHPSMTRHCVVWARSSRAYTIDDRKLWTSALGSVIRWPRLQQVRVCS